MHECPFPGGLAAGAQDQLSGDTTQGSPLPSEDSRERLRAGSSLVWLQNLMNQDQAGFLAWPQTW